MALSLEEVSQILEEFFNVVGSRHYVGARYVPIFGRRGETSITWDKTKNYEPLTIVLYQGNSYTSRQYVPAGVDITNTEFWANTGNYNAQVEQYHTDVLELSNQVNTNTEKIDTALHYNSIDKYLFLENQYIDNNGVYTTLNDYDTYRIPFKENDFIYITWNNLSAAPL